MRHYAATLVVHGALLVGLVDPVRAVAPESVAPVQIQALFRLYSGTILSAIKALFWFLMQ
jgi:hypothetical protein